MRIISTNGTEEDEYSEEEDDLEQDINNLEIDNNNNTRHNTIENQQENPINEMTPEEQIEQNDQIMKLNIPN